MKFRMISWAILFGALLVFSSCQKDDDDPAPPPPPAPALLKHAELTMLQRATKGQGIDIVILGDGFTANDRELWEESLEKCSASMFILEPFRSFREYFNVYGVSAVSVSNQYALPAPDTTFFRVYTRDDDRIPYRISTAFRRVAYRFAYENSPVAADKGTMENMTVAMLINDTVTYSGRAYMERWDDIPVATGTGLALFTVNPYLFDYLFIHETLGHAFGLLDDEYVEFEGVIPDNVVDNSMIGKELYGANRNTEYTNDPEVFLNSAWRSLYESGYPDVGIFEGGSRYEFGVWRSSEKSIMNGLSGGFNAVSREILVRRIYELAGMEDQYSLDVFLEYDKRNIGPQTRAAAPAIALPPAWYPPI